jgi:hypothetical protein
MHNLYWLFCVTGIEIVQGCKSVLGPAAATAVFLLMNPTKAQWLLYVPPGLTFTDSTFCPHSVFVCFVWISEQTAIISP